MDWSFIAHYFLHLIFPGAVAYLLKQYLFRNYLLSWLRVYVVLLATMLVDLDHLLADPIYDPIRCSIGFHPLHSWPALMVYFFLLVIPNKWVRMIGIGLIFHMLVDFGDCLV